MSTKPTTTGVDRDSGPGFWLGLLPFILMATAVILTSLPTAWGDRTYFSILGSQVMLWAYLVIILGLYFGIKAGFPRWVYPYLVSGLAFGFFLGMTATPGIAFFGVEMRGQSPWGPRALVPLIVVVLLVRLTSRDIWKLLDRLLEGLRADWTRLSFGLYALLPLIVWLGMDAMDYTYRFLGLLLAETIFILGAFFYLRKKTLNWRVFCLLAGAFLGYLAAAGSVHLYWDTHTINIVTDERTLLSGPIPIAAILVKSSWNAGLATLFVLLPAVLGLRRKQGPKPELDPPMLVKEH